MSQVKIVRKRKGQALLPLIGLILAVAIGIISYFLAPAVLGVLRQLNGGFGRGIPEERLLLFITIGVFFVLGSIASLLVAIARPKKKIDVKEADLEKERKQAKLFKEYEIQRQRKLNREMRKDVKARSESNVERFGDR
jgi:hypothetical protein